jgi:hypothetical protein
VGVVEDAVVNVAVMFARTILLFFYGLLFLVVATAVGQSCREKYRDAINSESEKMRVVLFGDVVLIAWLIHRELSFTGVFFIYEPSLSCMCCCSSLKGSRTKSGPSLCAD